MKHPLWIVNSSLLFVFILVLGFIFFSQEELPERESIEPKEYAKPIVEAISTVNIQRIYEDDLFDTYVGEFPERPTVELTPLPQPPAPQRVRIPEEPKPQFLEPLDISLKGIIILVHNDSKNRAIIENNKTKAESIYKVGDMIEDAQLIRIFSNKVMFVRSNGQQEVLYLREKDAKLDPVYAMLQGWDDVVQKVSENSYFINTAEFTHRIKNLSQFIDMLDLTTVYQKGKSIGSRIGQLDENSLGLALGFRSGDIILRVNGISAAHTATRYEIYQDIIDMEEDDVITVELQRNGQQATVYYTLKEFKKRPKEEPKKITPSVTQKKREEEVKEEQLRLMQRKYNVAPTVDQIRQQERRNMLHRGNNNRRRKFKLTE